MRKPSLLYIPRRVYELSLVSLRRLACFALCLACLACLAIVWLVVSWCVRFPDVCLVLLIFDRFIWLNLSIIGDFAKVWLFWAIVLHNEVVNSPSVLSHLFPLFLKFSSP